MSELLSLFNLFYLDEIVKSIVKTERGTSTRRKTALRMINMKVVRFVFLTVELLAKSPFWIF